MQSSNNQLFATSSSYYQQYTFNYEGIIYALFTDGRDSFWSHFDQATGQFTVVWDQKRVDDICWMMLLAKSLPNTPPPTPSQSTVDNNLPLPCATTFTRPASPPACDPKELQDHINNGTAIFPPTCGPHGFNKVCASCAKMKKKCDRDVNTKNACSFCAKRRAPCFVVATGKLGAPRGPR